jgi:predicted DNA-binding protein
MENKRVSFFMTMAQNETLKALSKATRVKMADYIREGIDLVLQKYRKELKKRR